MRRQRQVVTLYFAAMTTKTAPKKKPSKKRKSTSQKKRSQAKSRLAIKKLLLQGSLIGVVLIVAWTFYLNILVIQGFEGKRFAIPARVYSEAQDLYPDAAVSQQEVVSLLRQLGYREDSQLSQPGRFRLASQSVEIYNRGFKFWDGHEPARKLRLRFDDRSIASLTDISGNPVVLARLDPLYMGQVHAGNAEDRVLFRLEELPEDLLLGLLLVEDDRFFEHFGVSLRGIARALWVNFRSGQTLQGGSTLTNQLVKNLYLNSDRTLVRKFNEALMSLLLEFHYEKNDILETYLNEVYLGQQGARAIHGFGLGAEFYFGTTVTSLEVHQQALLVGLVKGPSYYNPRRHPERALSRRNLVLGVWRENGLISDAEYQRAVSAPLDVSTSAKPSLYPAFMDALRRQLAEDYPRETLLADGLTIFTTLNPLAQAALESSVSSGVDRLEQSFNLPDNQLQSAAMLTRPSTADVLAMVGNRDVKNSGFNRSLDAKRPVGSLLKPAVYLSALENGWTLADQISDAEVTVQGADGELWQPKNYDQRSHGEVLLVDALANSYNQATARLGMQVGLPQIFDVMKRLGVEDKVPPVPAVMLGAYEMSPYDVAQFYQTISGNGFYSPLNLVRAVLHPEQGVIQRFDLQVSQRFTPANIYMLQTALHETTQSGTAVSVRQRLPSHWWVAGKTGTTDDHRDAWFAGFTGDRQLVVWVGRDDNQSTPLTGATGALPIWIETMAAIRPFQQNRGMPVDIRMVSVGDHGLAVPSRCDSVRLLPFIIGSEPSQARNCSDSEQTDDSEDKRWWQRLFSGR